MKFGYFVPVLFIAISGFAADRTLQPERQRPDRTLERAIHAGGIAPTQVAQFSSLTCTDGTQDYDPGDTVCRAHDLWECQKDGHWLDLKKKC